MNDLLNLREKRDLFYAVNEQGFLPHMIAETGSKAWGTNVETSDHDLTVMADDTFFDVYQYPRTAIAVKVPFKGELVDMRVFSIEKFLRKILKSNLVAYEAIHTEWHHGSQRMKNILVETMDHFYDPREMFRSARGNLGNIRAGEMKGRRQQFRYAFICLQLIDGLADGKKPTMNVPAYLNNQDNTFDNHYPIIQSMFTWAMTPVDDDDLANKSDKMLRNVREYDFPDVVSFKQGTEREYMNAQFAAIKHLAAR